LHPPSNVVAQSHDRLRIRRFLGRHVGLDDMQFFQQIRRAVDPAESLRFGVLAISFGSIGSLLPALAGIFVQIGVSITPGWTVLTRIPSSAAAHSIATAFANRRTPPFVAQ
jgi:hypothetical protein